MLTRKKFLGLAAATAAAPLAAPFIKTAKAAGKHHRLEVLGPRASVGPVADLSRHGLQGDHPGLGRPS